MARYGLVIVALLTIVRAPQEPQWNRTAEENAVMAAVLDSAYVGTPRLQLMESTRGDMDFDFPVDRKMRLRDYPGVDSVMKSDYATANRVARQTVDVKPRRISVIVVTDSTAPVSRSADGGLVRISRPGFNADHTAAIIDTFLSCGTRCGRGGVYLLRKMGGVWRVVAVPLFLVA